MSGGVKREAHATTPSMAEAARRSRLRALLLGAIGLLYLVSIPWYRAADAVPPLLLGLPNWVAIAVGCYLGAACLNAVAWWIAPLSDALPADRSDGGEAGGGDDRDAGDEGAA